jgi:hypothetical protein
VNNLQLTLVLVASIWAAMNTLIAGYTAVNGTRDRVLTGFTGEGVPLDLEHRRILYRNDWLPLKAGLAAVSLAFSAFIVFLPSLAQDPARLRGVCMLAALLPLGAFLGFFVLGFSDRRLMLATLTDAQKKDSVDDAQGGLRSAPRPPT